MWGDIDGTTIVGTAGDVDGDGRDEVLVRKTSRFGLLTVNSAPQFVVPRQYPFGEDFKGFILSLPRDETKLQMFLGDIDGDHMADVLIRDNEQSVYVVLSFTPSRNTLELRHVTKSLDETPVALRHATEQWIQKVSDIDGDGAADLVVTSAAGLSIVRDIDGRMTSTNALELGTNLQGWAYTTGDTIVDAGQYDGKGGNDLLIRTKDGGLVTLAASGGGAFTKIGDTHTGTLIGTWSLKATDDLVAFGDFDGDGRRDIVLEDTSVEALGIVRFVNSRFDLLASTNMSRTTLDGLSAAVTHRVLGAADLSGDGQSSLLVLTERELGACRVTPAGGWSCKAVATGFPDDNTRAISPNGWPLSPSDEVTAVGSFDSQPGQDFILRR